MWRRGGLNHVRQRDPSGSCRSRCLRDQPARLGPRGYRRKLLFDDQSGRGSRLRDQLSLLFRHLLGAAVLGSADLLSTLGAAATGVTAGVAARGAAIAAVVVPTPAAEPPTATIRERIMAAVVAAAVARIAA